MSGVLTGERGEFDCPISIQLYGTNQAAERTNLKSRMQSSRLPVDALDKREKEAEKRRVAELKKVAKKGCSSAAGSNQQWEHGNKQPEYAGSKSS